MVSTHLLVSVSVRQSADIFRKRDPGRTFCASRPDDGMLSAFVTAP
jgi:hypothetical protein